MPLNTVRGYVPRRSQVNAEWGGCPTCFLMAVLRGVTTLPLTGRSRSDQKPVRPYHKIGYDTMACKALHGRYFPATMDSWAIAYLSNARILHSREWGP